MTQLVMFFEMVVETSDHVKKRGESEKPYE